MITAKIIKDSINPTTKSRLTTMLVRFHRFILPEVNTHRVFSRNVSSSRAQSIESRIRQVIEDPAIPVEFGANAKTMYATNLQDSIIELPDYLPMEHVDAWRQVAYDAAKNAAAFHKSGYHKQIVNRILEPFVWTDMVVSSTEWDSFFKLRIAPDAQPEIRALAIAMKEALDASTPTVLYPSQWHLPFISDDEMISLDYSMDELKEMSVVRCARVSYRTPKDTGYDAEKDKALFKQLKEGGHLSPFEHVATPSFSSTKGNFYGFAQFRQELEYNEKSY